MDSISTSTYDQAAVYTHGELTRSPRLIKPTTRQERISSFDVLRGISLMGILLMNIDLFALPGDWNIYAPIAMVHPAFNGPHAVINTVMFFLRWIFAEGKMRGLFSILFGAGVILMTSRAEERAEGNGGIADIFMRRNMWLVVIGFCHGFFIWHGDILVWYGLTGLLFLFPCRKLNSKTMLISGSVLLLVSTLSPITGGQAMIDFHLKNKADAAVAAQRSGKALSGAQVEDQKAWAERQTTWKPDVKVIEAEAETERSGYIAGVGSHVQGVIEWDTIVYFSLTFGDVLSMMLIGMALAKNGFLAGRLSYATYAWTAVIGLTISLPVSTIGAWKAWKSGFDLITTDKWLRLPYEIRRGPGSVAIAALILIILKSGIFPSLMKRFAAVGQTALSNYILTSLLCQFVFVWGPYRLYQRLEFYQNFYVLAAVWSVNLIWSSIWLKYFRFGPLEWVWRSLTYWKRQPMRLLGEH